MIAATVPTSGYAPGQAINVQIDVNNKSTKNISEFKIELNKVSSGSGQLNILLLLVQVRHAIQNI